MANIFGFIIFCLGVWAIFRIWMTNEDTGVKVLWTLLVAVLPIIGVIIWYFKGPGSPA